MPINLIPPPTGGAPLSTDDYNSQNILIQSLLYNLMQSTKHLTEWDTLTKPELERYSYIQHGGALFQVQESDYTITGAPSDGRVYVKITRTGDELDAEFVNSAVGYSWNTVYNGFYHSDGTQLLPYILYLDGSDYYKYDLEGLSNKFDISSTKTKTYTFDIGDWNMYTTPSRIAPNTGVGTYYPASLVVGVTVIIQQDNNGSKYLLNFAVDPGFTPDEGAWIFSTRGQF